MVAFMLYHAGMEAFAIPSILSPPAHRPITYFVISRNCTHHSRHGKASFPINTTFIRERFDHRVNQNSQRNCVQSVLVTTVWNMEHDDPQRTHLRRRKTSAIASIIVSSISSINRRIFGAVGSATSAAGAHSTGCPIFAIFSMAILHYMVPNFRVTVP